MVKKLTEVGQPHKRQTIHKGTLRQALLATLKAESGRRDICAKHMSASKAATRTHQQLPIEDRAGFPVKLLKGGVHPKDWRTYRGDRVYVDLSRAHWLPDEWGQGVKITHKNGRSAGVPDTGARGILTCFVAPDGKVFFHKPLSEEYSRKMGWTRDFTPEAGRNGQVRLARAQALQAVQLARAEMRDGADAYSMLGFDKDAVLFKVLGPRERRHLPDASEFHFCVISARRAAVFPGIGDVLAVQLQLQEAGVTPTWYVDGDSAADYRRLGFKVVIGGKLTASRNKALRDARRLGKVCVQLSDDISGWLYMDGEQAKERSDDAANAACAAAKKIIPSPLAAARFIVAKMRAVEGEKPHLGGVYPLGCCSRTFCRGPFARRHFILGDFFVVDRGSKVNFDEEMTLKEDYDFTCAHIEAHGSVMRCQRMTLKVKHYSNAGGACTNRDRKGQEEKRNIAILNRKWPGIFRPNPKRMNEVIMRWRDVDPEEEDDEAEDGGAPHAGARRPISARGMLKRPARR